MGSGAGDGVSIRSTTCAIVPMFGGPHLDSLDQAGLGEVVDGDYNGRPAFALGGQHGRQHPLYRTNPPVERQFAQQHCLFESLPRLLTVG